MVKPCSGKEEKELGLVLSSIFIFILRGVYDIGRTHYFSIKDLWPTRGRRWCCLAFNDTGVVELDKE